jgi:hypothetical protein
MCTPVATVVSPGLKNPPDPSDMAATVKPKDDTSARIRLVRWISSSKQVFIAELLVRSTGWGR